jgi:hypothetical protein
LRRLQTNKGGGGLIGKQYFLVVNNDDFRQSVRKVLEQTIPALDFFVALAKRIKQAIHGLRKLTRIGVIRNGHSSAYRSILRRLEHFLIETFDAPRQPGPREPDKQARHYCQ